MSLCSRMSSSGGIGRQEQDPLKRDQTKEIMVRYFVQVKFKQSENPDRAHSFAKPVSSLIAL